MTIPNQRVIDDEARIYRIFRVRYLFDREVQGLLTESEQIELRNIKFERELRKDIG